MVFCGKKKMRLGLGKQNSNENRAGLFHPPSPFSTKARENTLTRIERRYGRPERDVVQGHVAENGAEDR